MRYLPDRDFARNYAASDEALELVDRLAREVAPVAEETARRRLGHMAESVEAVSGIVSGTATGRVLASDFKARWYEFGTRRQPPSPFLRPAVESVLGIPVVSGAAAEAELGAA